MDRIFYQKFGQSGPYIEDTAFVIKCLPASTAALMTEEVEASSASSEEKQEDEEIAAKSSSSSGSKATKKKKKKPLLLPVLEAALGSILKRKLSLQNDD